MIKRRNKILLCSAICLLVLGGCKNRSPFPSISEETKQEVAKPVDCSTAEQDVAILEEERASVGKRMLKGVQSLLPISVVAGILLGDYTDRVKVAVGTYNNDLEAKIAEIQQACS